MECETPPTAAVQDIALAVDAIAHSVFPIRMDRADGLHLCVLNAVTKSLEARGYSVWSEHAVSHSHYCLKQDWTAKRHGRMDLIAYGRDHRIAIEFDTDGVLKPKTAEKLAEPGVEYSVGISYGGCYKPSLGFATRDRIREALVHAARKDRPRRMWFIIIVRKILEEICLDC